VCRRPGERREPLSLAVPATFAVAAAELGLSVALAVELALERAVAYLELESAGCAQLWSNVVLTARTSRIDNVASTNARYLRTLTLARRNTASAQASADSPIDVPLRFFPRVQSVEPTAALTPAGLEEALALEVAAVGSGRLMLEWIALTALRLRSAAVGDASRHGLDR